MVNIDIINLIYTLVEQKSKNVASNQLNKLSPLDKPLARCFIKLYTNSYLNESQCSPVKEKEFLGAKLTKTKEKKKQLDLTPRTVF